MKKRGRPPHPPERKLRVTLATRLTEKEADAVIIKALKHKVTVSQLIRLYCVKCLGSTSQS